MSIALKHIKGQKFILNTLINISSSEWKKRHTQIDSKRSFYYESVNISENKETSFKTEIKSKNPKTAKNLDAQTLNFWKKVYGEAPTLEEGNFINIVLEFENLAINPSNNAKLLNKIMKKDYNGYIKQTIYYRTFKNLEKN